MTIITEREEWVITNLTQKTLYINDLSKVPPLKRGETIDLIQYAAREEIENSIILNNYISKNLIKINPKKHTHDDKSDITHKVENHIDTNATGSQLNILTGGLNSNADSLHTHSIITSSITQLNENIIDINKTINVLNSDVTVHKSNNKNIHGIIDTNDLVRKSGKINQLSDVNIDGALLDVLTEGQKADDLHYHTKLKSFSSYLTFSISILNSVALDWDNLSIPVWQSVLNPINITKIYAIVSGSLIPILSFNLEIRTLNSFNNSGNDIFSDFLDVNSNGLQSIIFSNNKIALNSYLFFITGSSAVSSGTVDSVFITIYYSSL